MTDTVTATVIGQAGWLTTDRILALIGIVATLAGTSLALWQLMRTRRAAVAALEAAQAATEETTRALRSGDLRRLIEASLTCRSRLDEAARAAWAFRQILGDWLKAYETIVPMVKEWRDITTEHRESALEALEYSKGQVLVVRDLIATSGRIVKGEMGPLDSALVDYATTMGSVLMDLENAQVTRHV